MSQCIDIEEQPDLVVLKPLPASPISPSTGRSLRSLALRGSAWTLVGYGGALTLRLASSLILTRLLFPETFGVAALIGIFVQGLQMFADIGIGPNIVRSMRGDDPDFLNTAWTLQVGRGFVLWVGSLLIAWPAALFYKLPQIAFLLPVAGLNAILQGFNSTVLFTCTRRMLVGRLMALELTTQAVTLGMTVFLALLNPSVWALVFGGLTGSALKLVLSHRLMDRPHHFRLEPEARMDLFAFGKWIFVSTFVTFLAMQIDRMLLGKLVTLRELGLYTTALTLAQVPRDIIQRLSNAVVYPMVSRIIHSPDGLRKVTSLRRVLLGISSLMCATMLALAQPLVDLLFDRRYAGAGWFLSLLTVGTFLQTLQVSYGPTILASGKPKYLCIGVVLRLGIILIFVWPAFQHFGISGVAALAALSEFGVVTASFYGAFHLGFASARTDVMAFVRFVLTFLIIKYLCYYVRSAPGIPSADFCWLALAGATTLLVAVRLVRRGTQLEDHGNEARRWWAAWCDRR